MHKLKLMALAASITLAGCAELEIVPRGGEAEGRVLSAGEMSIHRAFEQSFEEIPFERGAMSVVATERGDLRTYRLVPCHNGIVCAGSARGRHGTVEATEDFIIVRGLYGRTFWLSPGGDGVLVRHGRTIELAWDSDVVEVGPEH